MDRADHCEVVIFPLLASLAPNHVDEDGLKITSLWEVQSWVVIDPPKSLVIISITRGSDL